MEYALPSLIALLLKTAFLFRTNINSRLSSAFVLLCLTLIFQNACEFSAFVSYASNPELSARFTDGYMVATYLILFSSVNFTWAVCGLDKRAFKLSVLSFSLFLVGMHGLGFLVDSYHYNGYALIAVRGDYYFLFEVFAIAISVYCMHVLINAIKNEEDQDIKSRAVLVSFAIAPYSTITIVFITAMFFGFTISSAIWVPLAGVLFLAITKKATMEEIYDMSKPIMMLRFFLSHHGAYLFDKSESIQERTAFVEKFLIMQALDENEGNQRAAADELQIAPSTLSRKIAKYGIDTSKFSHN